MRLKEKVALLLGCSPNIGRSIARVFAREGASVVVDDTNEPKGRETVALIEKDGGKAVFTSADVSRTEGVAAAVDFAVETYGRLDVLVSLANAGDSGSVAQFNRANAELCYAVNVLALIEGARLAMPHMTAVGGGSIISLSSIQASRGTGHNPAYAAAKAGIEGAMRSMAVELWQRRIRVNAIAPTGVWGPAWQVVDTLGWDALPEFEEKFAADRRHLPIGGVGVDSMDIAHAALFLASDESRAITGVSLPVDAGWTFIHYNVFHGEPPCETPEKRDAYLKDLDARIQAWIAASLPSEGERHD